MVPYAQIKKSGNLLAQINRSFAICTFLKYYMKLAQSSGKEIIMNKHFYVNNNQTLNPGLNHEVHTQEHATQLGIRSMQYVGYFASEVEAVAQAKKIYFDADGCATCCPKAHRG